METAKLLLKSLERQMRKIFRCEPIGQDVGLHLPVLRQASPSRAGVPAKNNHHNPAKPRLYPGRQANPKATKVNFIPLRKRRGSGTSSNFKGLRACTCMNCRRHPLVISRLLETFKRLESRLSTSHRGPQLRRYGDKGQDRNRQVSLRPVVSRHLRPAP